MNKASGGDGIPVELFQILKDDAVKLLRSICQQNWKMQQWPQDWKRSVFIPIPKKGNAKECSNHSLGDFINSVLDYGILGRKEKKKSLVLRITIIICVSFIHVPVLLL